MTTYTHTAGSPDYISATHTIRRQSRTSWLILVDGIQVAEARTYTEAKALAITQPEQQPEQPTVTQPELTEFKSSPATTTPAETFEGVHAEAVALASQHATEANRCTLDAALQSCDLMAVAGHMPDDVTPVAIALAKRAATALEAERSTDSLIRAHLTGYALDAYSASMADPEYTWRLVQALTDGQPHPFEWALLKCIAARMINGRVSGAYDWPWWTRLRLEVATGRRMPGLPSLAGDEEWCAGRIWDMAGRDAGGLKGVIEGAFTSPEPELRVEVDSADLRAVVISAREDGMASIWLDLPEAEGLTYVGMTRGDGSWAHVSGWYGRAVDPVRRDDAWAVDVLRRCGRIAGAMISTGSLVPP